MALHLAIFIQGFLVLFIGASLAKKLWHPSHFIAVLDGYALLPKPLVALASIMVMAFEAICLLMVFAMPLYGGLAITALMLIYSLAIGINIARGRDDFDCGCSWILTTTSSSVTAAQQAVWLALRNGMVATMALGLAITTSPNTHIIAMSEGRLLALAIVAAIFLNLLIVLIENLMSIAAQIRETRGVRYV